MGLVPNQSSNNQLLLTSVIIIPGFLTIVHQMRLLFNRFQYDCKEVPNDEELMIMNKYTKENKLYSYCITILFSLYFLSIISPSIINVILYLFGMQNVNKLTLILPVNDIANGGTLFYILLVYQILAGFVITITGSLYYLTYLVFVQHACYQFNVLIFKIRQLPKNKQQYILTVRNSNIPWEEYDWIVDIIKRYNRVLENVDLINNYSKINYLIAIIFAMIFVIFDFLYIFRISEILQSPKDAIESSLIFFASILLLYLNFYVGQKLLNHSGATYEEFRQIPFYKLSVKSQKLLLLTITRSMKPSSLSIGGIFVSSNEIFASIIRKAFSFATVYYGGR
ncbi:hypothetical protein M0802_011820 [Mischocyttarus mexicanus]|nr:hypothetical protein M0802_011820 [Mischocyttarus mexicanus]